MHFEIQAVEAARPAAFHRSDPVGTFPKLSIPGAHIPDENRCRAVTTDKASKPEINGGIVQRRGPALVEGAPMNSCVHSIGVSSVATFMRKYIDVGARVTISKTHSIWIAWLDGFIETEDNEFGDREVEVEAVERRA